MRRNLVLFVVVSSCLTFLGLGCSKTDKSYYAIERAGVVLGYMEVSFTPGDSATAKPAIERSRMMNRLSLLGKGVDVVIEGERGIDPRTGTTLYIDLEARNGKVTAGAVCTFEGDTVHYTPQPGGETRSFALDPDVFVGDSFDFSFLADVEPGDTPVTERLFDAFYGRVHTKIFTPTDAETLVVAGLTYPCVVFDTFNETNGAASRTWVDRRTWRLVRDLSADGASITVTDAGVWRRVRRTNIDDMVFAKVNVDIDDMRTITSMKVRAKVRSAGERMTPESLNVPGQRFSGTVENNVIDGVFEIDHPRYDGKDAPPFPPEVDEELERYLQPELAIESNDPAIAEKALELTNGATDSWDAVRRLSTFVATEIGGDIPGGGSALGTLKLGKAECGGHSRLLVALCRASGIPARTVMGCMYTGVKGGTFGQHMWNEVHMGEAGWVPVDATAREVDYVDGGHIRLGNLTSFNPIEMEVLDYEVGPPVPDPLESD